MMSWMHYQVIAAAQAGKNNDKRESYGDSLIIDPWGTVVGRLPGEFPMYILELHLWLMLLLNKTGSFDLSSINCYNNSLRACAYVCVIAKPVG